MRVMGNWEKDTTASSSLTYSWTVNVLINVFPAWKVAENSFFCFFSFNIMVTLASGMDTAPLSPMADFIIQEPENISALAIAMINRETIIWNIE